MSPDAFAELDRVVSNFVAAFRRPVKQSDFVLEPPPLGEESMDAATKASRATTAATKCRETAERYRAVAAELGDIVEQIGELADVLVPDPTSYDFVQPTLLQAGAARHEQDRAGDRLKSVQLALLARAGVWDIQADAYKLMEG